MGSIVLGAEDCDEDCDDDVSNILVLLHFSKFGGCFYCTCCKSSTLFPYHPHFLLISSIFWCCHPHFGKGALTGLNVHIHFRIMLNALEFSHPLCSAVFILNPNVGDILVMSSPVNFFSMVVFPALSRPLQRIHSGSS